ncbi:MAG: lipid A export permease/ATP-binding protein MsbA [Burkholderiaceae bacterium]
MALFKTPDLFSDPGLRRLFAYLPRYKRMIAYAMIGMVIAAGSSSLIAILLGKLTDQGFYEKNGMVAIWAPLALIGVSLLHGSSTFSSSYLLQRISQSVLVELRNLMFDRVLRWPAATYQRYPSGTVISKFVNEASNALNLAAEVLTTLVRDTLSVIALASILVWHNWQLTLVTLVVAPVIAVVLRVIGKRLRKLATGNQEALAAMTSTLQEGYEGQRVVKIYDGYAYEGERFGNLNRRLQGLAMRIQVAWSAGTPVTQLVAMSGVSVVVAVALLQAQAGLLTMGEFMTYLSAMLMMLPPLRHLASINASVARMAAAADSVFAMIDEEPERDPGAKTLGRASGAVEFRGVGHTYPGAEIPALKDFNLTVKPGEMIALVGASGSGKTTLINLIPRFLAPSQGEILFDGVAQSELTLASLRAQIALVSQDVVLFDDTIAANIAYGAQRGASIEAIRAAAQAAYLLPFIESLPDGFDTRVGEGGAKLSGGQRQRLSIARALLKDAPILLLDEATSALDTESEKFIQASLEQLMTGRTSFVVAHRLSTIEGADRIVVMEHGRIVEVGCHAELLAAGGMYAHLYHIQFSAPREAA